MNDEWLQKAIIETHRQADVIGFLSLIALILALIFVFLLRYIAKIMIFIIIILSTLGTIGIFLLSSGLIEFTLKYFIYKALCSILWYKYDTERRLIEPKKTEFFNMQIYSKDLYLGYAITATTLTVCVLKEKFVFN